MLELYKKDSKGKIRVYQTWTKGAELIQETGVVGGALVRQSKVCKGKNIGKTNETSPSEQALSEMQSRFDKKAREGYFKTVKEANKSDNKMPMLAKDYHKEKSKIDYPCYAQPKLDGMRNVATNESLLSRKNKRIENMMHIEKELNKLPDGEMVDGELYAHGYSFQENMKFIKKYRKGLSEKVVYHVYDMNSNETFIERYTKLKKLVKGMKNVEVVPVTVINNEKELKEAHKKFLADGYEGTIVRHGNKGYELNKRSDSLLKYKDFEDVAVTIHDIVPCEQRPEWGNPIFKWKGAEGHTYGDDFIGSGVRMSHDERVDMLKNKKKWIGKTGELRFFEYSDTGVPRFPVMVGVRLDK